MKDTIKTSSLVALVLAIFSSASGLAAEDSDALEQALGNAGEAKNCISLTSIDHTDILDDGFILFYMRGGDVYLNQLPYECPGLKSADTFMYRTSIGRLCNVDIITVIERLGFGLMQGASCGLGKFVPIDKETAKALATRSH